MRVLMFSSDPNLRQEGSKVSERMTKYEKALGELKIILLDRSRGRFLRFFKGYFEARRLLKREKCDVMTAQEPEHWFLAWLLSRKFGVGWQMQIHTDIFSPYYVKHSVFNFFRRILAKFLIPRASCVRVVSERIKKSIRRPDASMLPIFIDIKQFQEAPLTINLRRKYPNRDFYILMVSRLAREKNISLALEVLAELVSKYPKILLAVVGEGPERRNLEIKAKGLGLEDNVKFEGAGSHQDIVDYYRSADCLLLASNYEGYALVAMEALQCGLAVVMTDVGVAGEIVKNGENGLVAPVGSKETLVLALEKLYKDPFLRERLSGAARNIKTQTEEEYLRLYIESLKACAKSGKTR